jgi:23S rRNA pseudouridine2605 synthase
MKQSPKNNSAGLIPGAGSQVRLNKHLSSSGVTSRRKADEMILSGRIKVNGRIIRELGTKIDPRKDKVEVDGRGVRKNVNLVYILMNKPKNLVTTLSDEKGRRNVRDVVNVRERVYPVGRLDRNTTGVLLLTNDGELANRLMHPKHLVLKVYKATLDRPIRERELGKLKKGVMIDTSITIPDDIYVLPGSDSKEIGIAIHEGKHHLVKRIFESIDIHVVQLDRYSYAGLTHHGLQRGGWRNLSKSEILSLRRLVELDGETQS